MGKLGLVPGGYRATKPMPEALKSLVPAPTDSVRTMLPHDPDVETETMPHIISKTKRCAWQVKKLAAHFKGSTVAESCRNITQFILDYIAYKPDSPNHEQVRSPRRLVYDGHGDCDCFAVFIGACLLNLKIPFLFRIAKYTAKASDWSHIYVVALNGTSRIIMDPVANAHQVEVPYKEKKDFPINQKFMNGLHGLQSLDGLACCGTQAPAIETKKLTRSVMTSVQDLKAKGLVPTASLLQEAGIPCTKRVLDDGSMKLAVADRHGNEKLLPVVSRADTNINQKINPMITSSIRTILQNHFSNRSNPLPRPVDPHLIHGRYPPGRPVDPYLIHGRYPPERPVDPYLIHGRYPPGRPAPERPVVANFSNRSNPPARPVVSNFSPNIHAVPKGLPVNIPSPVPIRSISNGRPVAEQHPQPIVRSKDFKNSNPVLTVPVKDMSKPKSTRGLWLMAAGAVLVCVAVFTPSAKKDARLSGHRKKKASMKF